MSRRSLAVLILALWFGALGWLVQRHWLAGPTASDLARWPVPPGNAFHAVRLGDRQIGLTSLTIDTVPEGLRVTELVTIDLPRGQTDLPRRSSIRIEATYSRALRLQGWNSDLLTAQGRRSSRGTVQGDTLLTIISSAASGPAETLAVAVRRPVVLPHAVPLVAASRGLPRAGDRLNVAVYDPLEGEMRLERVSIAAESLFVVPDSAMFSADLKRWIVAHSDTVRAWRLDSDEYGLPMHRWIDAAGMTVQTEYPLGAVISRSAFEIVNINFRALPPAPWDTTPAAPSYRLQPGAPAPRAALTVLLWLAPPGPLPDSIASLNGGWQIRTGDTVRVRRPTAASEPEPTPEPRGVLPVVTALDPRVASVALATVPAAATPEAAAEALANWVRRAITLEDGAGLASPSRMLATRRATTQGRVRLLVALLAAAEIRARPVWGLVRVDDTWQLRPWVEAWTGQWRPLDPSYPGAAGSARLRLGTSGEARLLYLALAAGRLRFEVLEENR